MDQPTLSQAVSAIKRRVRRTIGAELSHSFRSTAIYQGYTGLCGEAEMALQEGDLDPALVAKLEEYAHKVIALWQQMEQPGR